MEQRLEEFINEFSTTWEISDDILQKLGLNRDEALFIDTFHPAHFYSRLRSIGMQKRDSKVLVEAYQKYIYSGINKFLDFKKMKETPSLNSDTICFHQVFMRNRPDGYGYGNCEDCVPDVANNPNCRGYYPFTIHAFQNDSGGNNGNGVLKNAE